MDPRKVAVVTFEQNDQELMKIQYDPDLEMCDSTYPVSDFGIYIIDHLLA